MKSKELASVAEKGIKKDLQRNRYWWNYLPTGFSQTSPSAIDVQGLAFKPATAALSRYAQNPESFGSPGSHCSVVLVKGDMSSQPQ